MNPTTDVDAVSTLKAKLDRRTKFQKQSDVINEQRVSPTVPLNMYLLKFCVPIDRVVQDVSYFSSLCRDFVVPISSLSACVSSSRGVLIAVNDAKLGLSPDNDTFSSAPPDGSATLKPSSAFFHSVARYANTTHINGASGSLFSSMATITHKEANPICSDLLNYVFKLLSSRKISKRNPENNVLIRTLDKDPKGTFSKSRTARAMLHANYRDDINHMWLLDQIINLLDNTKIANYLFNGDLLTGSAIIPDLIKVEKDSEYSGGMFFFSGEVGNRRAGIVPFVFRNASRSTFILGDTWGVTHNAVKDQTALKDDLVKYVHTQIPTINTLIDRLLSIKLIDLNLNVDRNEERIILAIQSVKKLNLTKRELRLWRVGVDVEKSLFDTSLTAAVVANALTRVAQAHEDFARKVYINTLAGSLIDIDWDRVKANAKLISDNKITSTFDTERDSNG